MNPQTARVVAAAIALLVTPHVALAGEETCYTFGGQEVGTAWPIEPQTEVPIEIGTIRVHPLKLDGVVQTPKVARFEVIDTAIARGRAPELAGTAVAIQMLPVPGVQRIGLRYAQQPGVNDGRAVTVEVNGLHREWRGGFERLHGEHLGKAGHPARFTVTPERATESATASTTASATASATQGNGWQHGRLVVEMKNGSEIRSFTLGAAHLRIDDVCFGAAAPSD